MVGEFTLDGNDLDIINAIGFENATRGLFTGHSGAAGDLTVFVVRAFDFHLRPECENHGGDEQNHRPIKEWEKHTTLFQPPK
jgi:hypothetical protein